MAELQAIAEETNVSSLGASRSPTACLQRVGLWKKPAHQGYHDRPRRSVLGYEGHAFAFVGLARQAEGAASFPKNRRVCRKWSADDHMLSGRGDFILLVSRATYRIPDIVTQKLTAARTSQASDRARHPRHPKSNPDTA